MKLNNLISDQMLSNNHGHTKLQLAQLVQLSVLIKFKTKIVLSMTEISRIISQVVLMINSWNLSSPIIHSKEEPMTNQMENSILLKMELHQLQKKLLELILDGQETRETNMSKKELESSGQTMMFWTKDLLTQPRVQFFSNQF